MSEINIDQLIADDVRNKTNKAQRERSLREYYDNPNYCNYCNEIILVRENEAVYETRQKHFCDRQCLYNYRSDNADPKYKAICNICGKRISPENQSGLCPSCLKKKNNEEKIQKWKETGYTGCGVSTTLRNCIRDYIFQKQDQKCAICGLDNKWNGKELHFILDHINGDASNDFEDNLRLVCPNCDSQLDTYKSKNKNSARTHRKNY